MEITIRPTTEEDIAEIASRMREADRIEVWAASRKTPDEALRYSLEKSSLAMTGVINGVPEVMFGAGDLSILTRTGAPWLLSTDAVRLNKRAFLQYSVEWRGQLLQRYDILRNVVDDRNTVSKRWLQWLGFRLFDPMPIGKGGEMFRLFEMRRENV